MIWQQHSKIKGDIYLIALHVVCDPIESQVVCDLIGLQVFNDPIVLEVFDDLIALQILTLHPVQNLYKKKFPNFNKKMHKLVNNKWFLSFCVPALARCEANRYFHYTFYSIWALKMLSQASFIQSYKGFFLYLRTFNLTDTIWTLHGRIGVWVCGDKAKSVLRCTLSVNVDFSILPKHTLTCSSVEEGIKWPSHLSHKICK